MQWYVEYGEIRRISLTPPDAQAPRQQPQTQDRFGGRDPAGPDGAWAAAGADLETAKAAHRRLVAEVKDGNPDGTAPRRNTTHPD